jgi:hypothetical protein
MESILRVASWRRPVLARTAVILTCSLALNAQSWDRLRELKPGERVKVLETAGQEHQGTFRGATADAVQIGTDKSELTIERARVKRVQVRSNARRARKAAILGGIGLAIGVTVDQTLGVRLRNEGDSTGRAAMYAVPIGLLGGIGASFPGYDTVYKAR